MVLYKFLLFFNMVGLLGWQALGQNEYELSFNTNTNARGLNDLIKFSMILIRNHHRLVKFTKFPIWNDIYLAPNKSYPFCFLLNNPNWPLYVCTFFNPYYGSDSGSGFPMRKEDGRISTALEYIHKNRYHRTPIHLQRIQTQIIHDHSGSLSSALGMRCAIKKLVNLFGIINTSKMCTRNQNVVSTTFCQGRPRVERWISDQGEANNTPNKTKKKKKQQITTLVIDATVPFSDRPTK